MVDAHYRGGAGILRVFRKTGRGRQSGEQEGHSQSTKDALRLASARPEGSYPICGEVHGITGYQDQSPRFKLKRSVGGASTVPLRSNGRLAQKTPDRAMKFPSSNTFLKLLRTSSCSE